MSRSHDQRALPEIPGGHLSNGGMQEDDEEDEEGHYDIITRHRAMAASASATSSSNPALEPASGLNLYEKVGQASQTSQTSQPAGAEASASLSPHNTNPYVTVDGIGNAVYAHINEKQKRLNNLVGDSGIAESRLAVMHAEALSAVSSDTLSDTASAPPPPVPDKHFANPDSAAPPVQDLSAAQPANTAASLLLDNMAQGNEPGAVPAASAAVTGDTLEEGPVMEINSEPLESAPGE